MSPQQQGVDIIRASSQDLINKAERAMSVPINSGPRSLVHQGVTLFFIHRPCTNNLRRHREPRWRPGAMAAEVRTETLAWQPDPAVEPLVVALAAVFRDL